MRESANLFSSLQSKNIRMTYVQYFRLIWMEIFIDVSINCFHSDQKPPPEYNHNNYKNFDLISWLYGDANNFKPDKQNSNYKK